MTTPLKHKPIRTGSDLRERWEELMLHGGFGRRSLWLIFLDKDGHQSDLIVPIDDIPIEPASRDVAAIADLVARIRDEVGVSDVPMLISRPGSSEMTDGDRRWAVALTEALRGQHPRWPIHLATRDRVQVFAADDLLEPRAG